MNIPRLVICGAASGSGKTTITCAILKAFKERGVKVSAAKCGPDYIDPMFHRAVLGIPSTNLDMFFCDEKNLVQTFSEHIKDSEICIIEGVMGYYDGMGLDTDSASTYEVARTLKAPAILVINGKGAALTLSALISGLKNFRKDSNIQGIILNNISKPLFEMLKPIIEKETQIKVIGYMPLNPEISFESRHLGLKIPNEKIQKKMDILGQTAENCINIDELLKIAASSPEISAEPVNTRQIGKANIAVARDDAFCFYYKENIELLEKMGANIKYFSPIRDKKLPGNTDGLILGGGYPELYAKELSENKSMLNTIKTALESGLPCLAECGGFMYLCKTMEDANRVKFSMADVFSANAFRTDKLSRFGYITLSSDNQIINGIKAHEFHYWDTDNNGKSCTACKPTGKRNWQCIHEYKNVIAGFPHLYYPSKPEFAEDFIRKCLKERDKR